MINPVSRVQKIASGGAGTALNASLPISIKVAEKTGYNRYNLKMGNKILSTKSMKNLNKLNLGIYEKALPKDIDWVERIKSRI